MKQLSQAEALLKHLGMTEYESRAYLALLQHGPLSAERVSAIAAIPLPRVYDTMAGMAQRGFIIVSKTRPQIFRVIGPEQLSKLLKEDEKKKFEDQIKRVETIVPQFLQEISTFPERPKTEPEIALSYVTRKVNIEKLWSDMHAQARKELLLFAGDLSWVAENVPKIKAALKRGVNYRILWCKSSKEVAGYVKKVMKLDIPLRFIDTGDLRGVIVDGEHVSLVEHPTGSRMVEKDAEQSGTFNNILINNKLIAEVFRRYFMQLWDKATPPERWLAKQR